MRKKFAFEVVFLLVLILVVGTGCNSSHETRMESTYTPYPTISLEENTEMLTQRQIDILREQGLPTEYHKLTTVQKSAITAIEAMLSYLESEHNMEFTYSGYWSGADGQQEHLEADCDLGTVTVYSKYSNGEFIYTDNFDLISAVPLYLETLQAKLDELFGLKNTKLFVYADQLMNTGYTEDSIIGDISASIVIFVNEDQVDNITPQADSFCRWIEKQVNIATADVYFYGVSEAIFRNIEEYNFDDVLMDHTYSSKLTYRVGPDGIMSAK